MKYYFSLRIDSKPEQIDEISNILGVKSNLENVHWGYKLHVDNHGYANFIDIFLKVLNGKYDALEKIGIERDDISIWVIYEYEGQCNLEFSPLEMKKLGENGITLCISCYEG